MPPASSGRFLMACPGFPPLQHNLLVVFTSIFIILVPSPSSPVFAVTSFGVPKQWHCQRNCCSWLFLINAEWGKGRQVSSAGAGVQQHRQIGNLSSRVLCSQIVLQHLRVTNSGLCGGSLGWKREEIKQFSGCHTEPSLPQLLFT